MTDQDAFRWWDVRGAQNLKPTTYICPLCDQQLQAVSEHRSGGRELIAPTRWSNHFRDAKTDAWKTEPRAYCANRGWRSLRRGEADSSILDAYERGEARRRLLERLLAPAGSLREPERLQSSGGPRP